MKSIKLYLTYFAYGLRPMWDGLLTCAAMVLICLVLFGPGVLATVYDNEWYLTLYLPPAVFIVCLQGRALYDTERFRYK